MDFSETEQHIQAYLEFVEKEYRFSAKEARLFVGCSRHVFAKLVRDGRLTCVPKGEKEYFSLTELCLYKKRELFDIQHFEEDIESGLSRVLLAKNYAVPYEFVHEYMKARPFLYDFWKGKKEKEQYMEKSTILLTSQEASQLSGYTDTTLLQWERNGWIRAVRIGKKTLYEFSSLEAFLLKEKQQVLEKPVQKEKIKKQRGPLRHLIKKYVREQPDPTIWAGAVELSAQYGLPQGGIRTLFQKMLPNQQEAFIVWKSRVYVQRTVFHAFLTTHQQEWQDVFSFTSIQERFSTSPRFLHKILKPFPRSRKAQGKDTYRSQDLPAIQQAIEQAERDLQQDSDYLFLEKFARFRGVSEKEALRIFKQQQINIFQVNGHVFVRRREAYPYLKEEKEKVWEDMRKQVERLEACEKEEESKRGER